MTVFDERKIDCHMHVFDPARFPYDPRIAYHPSGQEVGTPAQFRYVMATYGVTHSVIVQPNSGYGGDNACLLDTIARGGCKFKGIAIIDFDADEAKLCDLKSRSILGAAFNPTFHGTDYYRESEGLVRRLADHDMFLQIQSEFDQLLMFMPWIEKLPLRVLIDHCGRPTPEKGLNQPGFAALLRLADTGRVSVKLSGFSKFSRTGYPFDDCMPFVRAIVSAFGVEQCMWASDWPFLRALERQDYGPLVALAERLFPDPVARRTLFWDTPCRLFGFGERK